MAVAILRKRVIEVPGKMAGRTQVLVIGKRMPRVMLELMEIIMMDGQIWLYW